MQLDDRYVPNEELPSLFAGADVFVAPYVDGSQSAAARMALAFSVPMVITDVIADDLPHDREDIRIVRSGDAVALAGAIQEVSALEWSKSRRHRSPSGPAWADVVADLESLVSGQDGRA